MKKILQLFCTFAMLHFCTTSIAQSSPVDRTGISFDGVNDYINIPTVLSTANPAEFTMQFWVRFDSVALGAGVAKRIIYNGNSGADGWGLFTVNGEIYILEGGIAFTPTGFTPEKNIWYHFALFISSYNEANGSRGSLEEFYADGVLKKSVPFHYGGIRNATSSITVGGAPATAECAKITIDELRIWRGRAISETDRSCKPGSTNLVHFYDFSEGTANGNNASVLSVTDNVSSGAVAGTLTNMAKTGTSSNYVTGIDIYSGIPRFFVNQNVVGGTNNGDSWANAFNNLDTAIKRASKVGSCNGSPQIWVAKGTYKPAKDPLGNASPADARDKTFYIDSSVKIYGGFAGTESSITNRVAGNNTILSGDIGTAGNSSDNAYHVIVTSVNGINELALDGLVISDGNANVGSSFTINANTLYRGYAGALYIGKIVNSLYCENMVFTNNIAIANGSILRSGNISTTKGVFQFTNSLFYGNTSSNSNIYLSKDSATFSNCDIVNNIGATSAVTGSFLSGNQSFSYFYNSIFRGNNGTTVGGATLTNTSQNCILEGTDPRFKDISNPKGSDDLWMTTDDGLSLMVCSPGVDSGQNNLNTASKDITGQPRLFDVPYVKGITTSRIDIGAYESQRNEDISLFAGSIGNGHTIAYPQQKTPDSVTNIISPVLPAGADENILWLVSNTGLGLNYSNANPASTQLFYIIPSNQQENTFYQRVSTVCGVEYKTNELEIKVFSAAKSSILGVISGRITVQAAPSSGVEGVRMILQKTSVSLKGSPQSYTDTVYTVADGTYSFNNIFFGDQTYGDPTPVNFTITPYFPDHEFDNLSRTANLSNSSIEKPNIDFSDLTAYVISGKTYQICEGCLNTAGEVVNTIESPKDSVNIYLNKSLKTQSGYISPEWGQYSLTVTQPGNYKINPKYKNHTFIPDTANISVVSKYNPGVNFRDVTTKTISGIFSAGCGDYIGKAVLRFTSIEPANSQGSPLSFVKTIKTNDTGFYTINLPARKYRVSVDSFYSDPNEKVPVEAEDLKTFFNITVLTKNPDALIRDIDTANAILNLVYQRPPTVKIDLNGPASCNAGAIDQYDIWQQGQTRPVYFSVWQGPIPGEVSGFVACPLTYDSVTLSTNVHVTGLTQEDFHIPVVNDTAKIILQAGTPNTVDPYTKAFSIVYKDQYDRYATKQLVKTIAVTGVLSKEGSFTTVSPAIPLMVLHDPPGDRSYSFWETSRSIEQAMRFYTKDERNINAWADVKVGASFSAGSPFFSTESSVWATAGLSAGVTARNSSDREAIVTTTTNQRISTSSQPDLTGAEGDLFYGAAINMLYSIAQEVYDSSGCEIRQRERLMVSPAGFKTEYLYTQNDIEQSVIPTLQKAAESNSNSDSVAFFNNQANVWQQVLDNNEANKKKAAFQLNRSFTGGGNTWDLSSTTNSTQANTIEFSMELDAGLSLELGFDRAGSGISGGVNVNFKMESGNSVTNTTTNSTTIGYHLEDDDVLDNFSVNVKKDPVYNTPVFETIAGQSSCPAEDNTLARDDMQMQVFQPILTNIKGVDTVFRFNLGNNSSDAAPRTYSLSLDARTNTFGAVVSYAGNPIGSNPYNFTLAKGQSQTFDINVKKNPGNSVYSYEGLLFTFSDACGGTVSQTQNISAFFNSPCSNINLKEPQNGWVRNGTNPNSLNVVFDGYTLSSLNSVTMEYSLAGKNIWFTGFTKTTAQITSVNATTVAWDITNIPDGDYDLRLKLICNSGVVYSQRSTGIIDRSAPSLFGAPEPTDDNYTLGDIIAFSYTENINTSNLSSNVSMQNLTDNTTLPLQVSGFGNRLVIVPSVNLSDAAYYGKQMQVIVQGIKDIYGNIKTQPDTSIFLIGTSSGIPIAGNKMKVKIAAASFYEDAAGTLDISFILDSAVNFDQTINFSTAGTADYGTDYTAIFGSTNNTANSFNGIQGTILIPKNTRTAILKIDPVADLLQEADENIVITLSSGGNYILSDSSTVEALILSDEITVPVIAASPSTTICAGSTATLSTDNMANGNPVASYLWSNGAITQSINLNTSGVYTVKITAIIGGQTFSAISAPVTVTVNPLPTPVITGTPVICGGSSAVLDAGNYSSYLWSNGVPTKTNTVSTTGSYNVTVTDANGCIATSAPVTVISSGKPKPTISFSGPTTFCDGDSVRLYSSTGTTFLWSTGATTSSMLVKVSGSYKVTVSNNAGCIGTSSSAKVVVNPLPAKPVITATGSTALCVAGTVVLTSSVSDTYLWNTNAITRSITTGTPGNYWVKIANANGCSNISDTRIVSIAGCDKPTGLKTSAITATTATLTWTAINCGVQYSVQIRKGGTTAWTTYTSASVSFNATGLSSSTLYEWRVATVCQISPLVQSSYSSIKTFTTLSSALVVQTGGSGERVASEKISATVYPNPAKENAMLQINGMKSLFTVIISGTDGKIFWQSGKINETNVILPVSKLVSGIYMIRIQNEEQTETLKLVKE